MFLSLLALSIMWLALFIASAGFDVWFELARPSFLLNNPFGRLLAALGIAPFILTLLITAIVSIPFATIVTAFQDPWGDDGDALDDTFITIAAAFEWFTQWAPAFVLTGEE